MIYIKMPVKDFLRFILNHFYIKACICFNYKEFPAAVCNAKKIIRNFISKLAVIYNN